MNQRFTTQQQRIATTLKQLVENFPKSLNVSFIRKAQIDPYSKQEKLVSKVYIDERRRVVQLHLVEAENGNELDQWAELIARTEDYIQQLENERLHELETPDYFKYLCLTVLNN